MFADPQSVTINSVAQSLARTSAGANSGSFKKDDGTVSMDISHQYGKRVRRVVRLNHQKITPDPLFPAQNSAYTSSVYLVVDEPSVGYSRTEIKQIVDALTGYLTASSGAKTTQLLGGES
jgi:hypothetical protein